MAAGVVSEVDLKSSDVRAIGEALKALGVGGVSLILWTAIMCVALARTDVPFLDGHWLYFYLTWIGLAVVYLVSLFKITVSRSSLPPTSITDSPLDVAMRPGREFRRDLGNQRTLVVTENQLGGWNAKITGPGGAEKTVTSPPVFKGFNQQEYDPSTDTWKTLG